MRFAVPALALTLAGCFDESHTIELDVAEVRVPMGAASDVGIWVDSHELSRLDAFSWVVDRRELVAISYTADHAKVRITGRAEGETIVHLGYRTQVIDVPTFVAPPAVVGLTVDPAAVASPIGSLVAVRATAVYTTGETRDVSDAAVWVIDDPAVATVDDRGVRGVAAGTTTLHAFVGGTQRTATVTIAP